MPDIPDTLTAADAPPVGNTTTADHATEDATTALYRSAIGSVRTGYYLPVFSHFEETERFGVRWNWAACLGTLNWLAYRQLWIAALAYVGALVAVALLVFGIGRLIFQFTPVVESALLLGCAALAFVLPGLYGNALFHRACRKKMASALTSTRTLDEACALLQQQASTRRRMVWLALVNAVLLGAVGAAYALLPLTPLSIALPGGLDTPALARNQAAGRAVDASSQYPWETASSPAAPAASAPSSAAAVVGVVPTPPASAPAHAASAPAALASAPVAASLASTPQATASAAAVPAATPVKQQPQAEAAAKAPPKAAPSTAKAPQAAPTAPAATRARAAKAKAPTDTHYLINVGLFADPNNALNAYVKLTDAGLPATRQEFNTSKGKHTRVRVGPLDSAYEAQAMVEKIQALGLDAQVLAP